MISKFKDYNFSKEINQVLDDLGFEQPSPIQSIVIPKIRKKENVVGVSATGSGKSHAFILPIVEGIDYSINAPQAIIMVPTRELAQQLFQRVNQFKAYISELKTTLLIGGTNLDTDKVLDSQIIIGTPGRIMDAISNRHILKLTNLRYFVLDEADMIFDDNFIKDTDEIMSLIKDNVNFSIFSATITQDMHPFLKKYFKDTTIIEIDKNVSSNVNHVIVQSKENEKFLTLLKLTKVIDPYLCIIFASRKSDVHDLYEKLNASGVKCIELHGDLTSRERSKALKRINNLEFKYVIASDIVARGIDIEGISHIISYDLPIELEYYMHRSGRTGRYDYEGTSYLIYTSSDEKAVRTLEKKGIKFAYYEIKDNALQPAGFRVRGQREFKESEASVAIKKITGRKEKVKPNYKKKRKQAIEKIKRKERQQVIKERIKKQRKQRKRS